MTAAVTALFPLGLVAALMVDKIRGTGAARTWVIVQVWLLLECAGVLIALFLTPLQWLAPGTFRDLNYALQAAWARGLLNAIQWTFSLTVEWPEVDTSTKSAGLLLVRHTSLVDTLLPVLLLNRAGRRPRYVLKRELLADPCLDLVGSRTPNAFIDRSGLDTATQLRVLYELGASRQDDDTVVLFPEGTHFTQARRQRALERLADDPVSHAYVRSLERTLPPRTGGALTLLQATQGSAVTVLAHTGLEGVLGLRDLLRGGLTRRVVRLHAWRFDSAHIPRERPGQIAWLRAVWQGVDVWVLDQEREAREASQERPDWETTLAMISK